MLNFNAPGIGATRSSSRTPTMPPKTKEQLVKEMLRHLTDVDIDHGTWGDEDSLVDERCSLIGPSSILKKHDGKFTRAHCKQKRGTTMKCTNAKKRKNPKDCQANRNCTWQKSIYIRPYTECIVDGKTRERRKLINGGVTQECLTCTRKLTSENRWGCKCGHSILCRTCFVDQVKKFGHRCPVCNHFCDADGYCRNAIHNGERVRGVAVSIVCPICRAECKECYAIDVRE